MNVLGIIPARGGSKSVPRKNLYPLLGKPLIAYTIEAALQSRRLTRTIVSTEDEEIAAISRALGAEVPFRRPAELATDEAPSLQVIQHALRWVEEAQGMRYDVVVMLQPTTPLRDSADIDAAVELLIDREADSVISIAGVGGDHPVRMKRLLPDGRLVNYLDQAEEDMRPRQHLPPVYLRNGALYIMRRDVLLERHSFTGTACLGYVMPKERSVNVDEPEDLIVVEHVLIRRHQQAQQAGSHVC